MKPGDTVIHIDTGSTGKILSMNMMAEMCYEVQWEEGPKAGITGLLFSREIIPLKDNLMPYPGGAIIVQSCDETTANVGVTHNGRIFYRHIEIPTLRSEYVKKYYGDISDAEFDKIIAENKTEILSTITKLNRVYANDSQMRLL